MGGVPGVGVLEHGGVVVEGGGAADQVLGLLGVLEGVAEDVRGRAWKLV